MSKSLSEFTFKNLAGDQLSDEVVEACANLFSNHYGVWAPNASSISKSFKPGARVKMNARKLRESVTVPERTVVAVSYLEDQLVGHAFATSWASESGQVGWITQLVVHQDFRRRGIASELIDQLKGHTLLANISVVGLASSNPVSCAVLAKYAGVTVHSLDMSFIRENARKVIKSSPVEYLKTAELRGSLFLEDDTGSGAISSVDTQFYVDHGEPLEALEEFKSKGPWSLGELKDGFEFLVMCSVKR